MILSFSSSERFGGHRTFLICLNSPIRESIVLRRAKVKPGTYSGDLLANLFDAIVRRSLELKSDYKKYYSLEYASISEYARKRLLIPLDVAISLEENFEGSWAIFYFHPNYRFLDDDYGSSFLEKLFEPGRLKQ